MTKIAIVGGGFAGLGTAYYLKDLMKNNEVTILEYNDHVGGLASGFKAKEWEWPVDRVIHHWFTTDKWALTIAKEIGLGNKIIERDTRSSCFYKGKMAELDSPISLLKFPFLNIFDRLRMGVIMAGLRLDKNYLRYENETAFSFLRRTMGKKPFEVVWKPLFEGKFGRHAKSINAAWFWARVHPRTKSLAYIEGGFQTFADEVAKNIEQAGGRIVLNAKIKSITKKKSNFEIKVGNKKMNFDHLVLAVPLPVALQLYNFPREYAEKYSPLKSIGAQYFVLELKHSFLKDGTYWLNVNDEKFPFMMVAEHTNFVNKKHYNNKHIIWVGKYLDYDDPLWLMSEKEFLDKIIPYLKQINPSFDGSWIGRSFFTKFKNAQPILPLGYSKKIPPIETPEKNLYIANMNHVYPWDRGTNNALGLGERVAKIIKRKLNP
jgi:protoporphyrinogen oxidase